MATLINYEILLYLWDLEYRWAIFGKSGKEPSERFMQKMRSCGRTKK